MNNLQTNILELFKKEFKIGDQVIVVHEDCNLYFGRLVRFDGNEIAVGSKEYLWDEVVLIAHDGFPCRQFHSLLSLEQFDKVENWESMLALYKAMDIPLVGLNEDVSIEKQAPALKKSIFKKTPKPARLIQVGYGCPFEIRDVDAMILNPFNSLWDTHYEETLVMKSNDGAIGMLWNLENEILEVNV